MIDRTRVYDSFAKVLSYPNKDIGFRISDFGFVNLPQLEEFKQGVEHLTIEETEELYTRTFDINPVSSLEIGWHLYGEQYERGAFMVQMRQMLHKHFIEETSELPDHLTHVLLLLGRLEQKEADEFAAKYLLPSLEKILEGFKEVENPYKSALLALKSFVEHEHRQGVAIHE